MVETPDEIQEVSSHYCMECGKDLSEVEGVLEYVTQQVDLPQIRPIYRERRFYKKSVAADVAIVIMHRVAGAVMLLSSAKHTCHCNLSERGAVYAL